MVVYLQCQSLKLISRSVDHGKWCIGFFTRFCHSCVRVPCSEERKLTTRVGRERSRDVTRQVTHLRACCDAPPKGLSPRPGAEIRPRAGKIIIMHFRSMYVTICEAVLAETREIQ